jgi:hypothetical protein
MLISCRLSYICNISITYVKKGNDQNILQILQNKVKHITWKDSLKIDREGCECDNTLNISLNNVQN